MEALKSFHLNNSVRSLINWFYKIKHEIDLLQHLTKNML